jgi:hypothetical protein
MSRECLVTLRGESYTGTTNMSTKGSCIPWSSPTIPYNTLITYGQPVDHFPDHVDDLSKLHNYCRNPVDLKLSSTLLEQLPWCFRMANTPDTILMITPCNIPYCNGKYFVCSFTKALQCCFNIEFRNRSSLKQFVMTMS